MEIGSNMETATAGEGLGAILFAIWIQWRAYAFKKTMFGRTDDLRGSIETQGKELRASITLSAKESQAGLTAVATDLREEIASHALYDAQTYMPRTEIVNIIQHMDTRFSALDAKMDQKIDTVNSNIITMMKNGKGSTLSPLRGESAQ